MDIIDVGLFASYILIVLCALAAVIIPLIQSMDNPQSLVKAGIGLGVVIVVFLIGYILADPDSPGVTATTSKMVGAGIISMYIFFFLALAGIVYTEISKMIN